mmetsp:Transcript_21985/g.16352  ORF Transcript_21985/g.16352 Transcript_21985/m.16352 type:complete len:234 (+) Transcript_21985:154-855(+)
MFSIFNCFNVDGDERVYDNMEVMCEGETYRKFTLGLALPGIILWGLGIPFFSAFLMSREKNHLDTVEVKEKYGFLYRGYKKRYYYWETIITYRKIVLIVIQIYLQKYGVMTQALIVFLLLILCMLLSMECEPFLNASLNRLELYSLVASMVTIYCGLFFIADSQEFSDESNQTNFKMSEAMKTALFALIVVVNGIYFGYWGIKVIQVYRNYLILRFGKIYMILCLCCNNQKLT